MSRLGRWNASDFSAVRPCPRLRPFAIFFDIPGASFPLNLRSTAVNWKGSRPSQRSSESRCSTATGVERSSRKMTVWSQPTSRGQITDRQVPRQPGAFQFSGNRSPGESNRRPDAGNPFYLTNEKQAFFLSRAQHSFPTRPTPCIDTCSKPRRFQMFWIFLITGERFHLKVTNFTGTETPVPAAQPAGSGRGARSKSASWAPAAMG